MIKLLDILAEINKEDCNCGCSDCKSKPMRLIEQTTVSTGLNYHLQNNLKLSENIFRTYSTSYFALINEVRDLYKASKIDLCEEDLEIIKTDIGKKALLENGVEVWLDMPALEENVDLLEIKQKKKTPPIGKPKRGGSKKFYVYVRDKGKIKKVSFGDTTGLSAKINNPKARRAFAKRHRCGTGEPKTSARFWSCRIGRYWKQLGGSKNFYGYW